MTSPETEPRSSSRTQPFDERASDANLAGQVAAAVEAGARFAGLYGSTTADGCRLNALLAEPGGVRRLSADIAPADDGELHYPALTPSVPSAFWYERAAHDLSGVVPDGHPRLDPLLLALESDSSVPHPGASAGDGGRYSGRSQTPTGPVDVQGHGMFTMPLGPVRSGVFESIEFLIETPGEDIPHLNIRPHYKHRGVAKSFEGLDLTDGVLVAERVEGIASVAHALAFSHAAESICQVEVPRRAGLIRVLHAELERIANHLEMMIRMTEAAGFAVANSRFGWHKESVLRLISRLCGSRFGRSVVVPGGVVAAPRLAPPAARGELETILRRVERDAELAMRTPSFLDRLRGTGPLAVDLAQLWGALGPVGRGSAVIDDNRWSRPTDAYPELTEGLHPAEARSTDVLARVNVRLLEIGSSGAMAIRALELLNGVDGPLRVRCEPPTGDASGLGWSEAPQGEALHALELVDGRIGRCFARSASLHNLVLFHNIFDLDVLTDFAFNEGSFGLGYAGVAM